METVTDVWAVDLEDAQALGGSTGLNLRADGADGPVVVRVHRSHVTAARVEALQLAREAARDAGVPTALPRRGPDGQRQTLVEGRVVEVEEFVDSDGKMDTQARIAQAMPWLGRLHDALGRAELTRAGDDLVFANFIAAGDVARKVTAGAARIRSVAPIHAEIADGAEALAGRLDEAGSAGPALESQWCHGDFWDNNVLFRGDQIALITDFGFMNRRHGDGAPPRRN